MAIKLEGFMQECVDAFVKVLSPKRIYLFGSYARGDYNECSDYDFYIIMDDSIKLDGEEGIRAKMELFNTSYEKPVDILVGTESSFLRNSSNIAYVDYYVKKEGVIIYER